MNFTQEEWHPSEKSISPVNFKWASGGMADTQRSERCLSNGVKVQLLSRPQYADVVKWYTRYLEVVVGASS